MGDTKGKVGRELSGSASLQYGISHYKVCKRVGSNFVAQDASSLILGAASACELEAVKRVKALGF